MTSSLIAILWHMISYDWFSKQDGCLKKWANFFAIRLMARTNQLIYAITKKNAVIWQGTGIASFPSHILTPHACIPTHHPIVVISRIRDRSLNYFLLGIISSLTVFIVVLRIYHNNHYQTSNNRWHWQENRVSSSSLYYPIITASSITTVI